MFSQDLIKKFRQLPGEVSAGEAVELIGGYGGNEFVLFPELPIVFDGVGDFVRVGRAGDEASVGLTDEPGVAAGFGDNGEDGFLCGEVFVDFSGDDVGALGHGGLEEDEDVGGSHELTTLVLRDRRGVLDEV